MKAIRREGRRERDYVLRGRRVMRITMYASRLNERGENDYWPVAVKFGYLTTHVRKERVRKNGK